VKGAGWSASTTSGLTYAQTGTPTHAGGPSIGSITLLPVVETTGVGAATASYGVSDSAAALFESFSKTGSFPPMTNALSGLEAGGLKAGGAAFAPTVAAHGAAAVSTSVRAGETVTLSIVFAWHFPHRDYDGHIFGNFYSHLWDDSAAVAQELASPGKLSAVMADINTHHHVIAHPENPTPDWLKDMLGDAAHHQLNRSRHQVPRSRHQVPHSCHQVPRSRHQVPHSCHQLSHSCYQLSHSCYFPLV
jgi:hypothetical protein